MSDSEIKIADYILKRLEQLNVKSVFGVPGDFNLGFLDYIEDSSIEWIGACNELNASYAADGYARVKESSLGVLVTTFGVGELSAINGIAGSFSEHVPVLSIVGVPSTTAQKNHPMLHHTLGDGRYDAYYKAACQFTHAQATLTDAETAAKEIDRVIVDCITTARPAYLTLPTDLVAAKVSASPLETLLKPLPPPNDPKVEAFILDDVERLFKQAEGDAVILVDACTIRHGVRKEVEDFVNASGLPVYAAPMGKTAISESHKRYGGLYVGSLSHPETKERVESAKLVISIGAIKSDFNTGSFSYKIPDTSTIELHSDKTQIQYAIYPDIGMKALLPKLSERLAGFSEQSRSLPVAQYKPVAVKEDQPVISQEWFWSRFARFFKPKDVVIAETGTSSFGILDVPFPDGAIFVSQILWGSIGFSVGCTLGCALAVRELGLGRTILFVGDGSLQLTAQEVSSMIRTGVKPIIFVLNNDGYTIERMIHGKERNYNDIAGWQWPALLTLLGGKESVNCRSYTVKTKMELSNLLDDPAFAAADKIQLVEVMMEKLDAPRALRLQAEMTSSSNTY